MMEKILIFVKHNMRFVWRMVEGLNNLLFMLLYKKKVNRVVPSVLRKHQQEFLEFRQLHAQDALLLFGLINSQNSSDLKYFSPHGFDLVSITSQLKKESFLMMGVFDADAMVGYFFLRFFSNKKCFVGRLIDKDYRGQRIGLAMNNIMYQISWDMGFRCLSTISKNNSAIIKAHKRNSAMIILKELQNDYLLVEFVKGKRLEVKP